MELVWEDPPPPDGPFFTKDLYDKFSLAPNIRELFAFLQSPVENANIKQVCDVGAAKASCPHSTEGAVEDDVISKNDHDSDDHYVDSVDGEEKCKDKNKSKEKLPQVENEALPVYPEPRLPFPCLSNLSSKDQKTYLGFLMNKKTSNPPQHLKAKANEEIMQFMGYLKDVAKMCADDYNFISQGALQYSEDFFRGCLECIKTFPQLYQIHEMTSLTGGTFNPRLTLTFEKQLLIMGSVDITDHKILPADAQLASDYQSVSSEKPPAKKAKDLHATISSDGNAEKLCAHYQPHVCLTREALVKLLDNHSPDFAEPWEIPVWIKVNPGKGTGNIQRKTVYIDSPLLKTEMTVRERSHFYHEESLKLSIKKTGSKNVFHVMTELPVGEQQRSLDNSQRNQVFFENSSFDFEVDLTDLETFGETTSKKASEVKKMHNKQDACVKSKKEQNVPLLTKSKTLSEHHATTRSSSLEEMDTSLAIMDDSMTKETTQQVESESNVPKTEQVRQGSVLESVKDLDLTGDSEDEKLVIDVSVSPATKQPESTPCSPDRTITLDPVNTSSPQKVRRRTRQSKRFKADDQLGEILRMQTAMFKSANDTGKNSTISLETNSPTKPLGPSVHSHSTSLVKPCVYSYLERNQNQNGETCVASQSFAPVTNTNTTECKKILSQDLQASAEDEQDYNAPEEGNLLYKLYSLQDLLVMVRSSVSLTHSRNVGSKQNQYVPVHVLPKLEYQLSYGVECLTNSEACQLWTETLLHSSTVSYIAHISAHTSKVSLLRKLPDDWQQNLSCGFKPARSLNILHHVLKKLTELDEGQYLIVHKTGEPFVTLLKTPPGKVTRGAYNLQQLHSSVPQPPTSGLVPWIPVDPTVVLPFHQAHGRVPCTFPTKPFQKTQRAGANRRGARQSSNLSTGNAKRKQNKRAARRGKFIVNLIQKSI